MLCTDITSAHNSKSWYFIKPAHLLYQTVGRYLSLTGMVTFRCWILSWV